MNHWGRPGLLAIALLAAAPAAAQGRPGGPGWQGPPPGAPGASYGGGAIPAPGQVRYGPPPGPVAPPHAGPVPGAPIGGSRVWQNGRWVGMPPQTGYRGEHRRDRWGGTIDGRWYAGAHAPGGWRGYHRLGRGGRLPHYWLNNSFRIPDYLSWGLAAPPPGYFWVRYYDDAVLADDRGEVWDSIGGIGWADGDAYADSYEAVEPSVDYAPPRPLPPAPPIMPVDPNVYYQDYGRGYAAPVAVAPPPPSVQVYGGSYGSYQAGAYYYGVPTSSTVVVTVPTTTTTVTEEVIETRTYRAAPRRVVRKAPVRRRVACCVCGCR